MKDIYKLFHRYSERLECTLDCIGGEYKSVSPDYKETINAVYEETIELTKNTTLYAYITENNTVYLSLYVDKYQAHYKTKNTCLKQLLNTLKSYFPKLKSKYYKNKELYIKRYNEVMSSELQSDTVTYRTKLNDD